MWLWIAVAAALPGDSLVSTPHGMIALSSWGPRRIDAEGNEVWSRSVRGARYVASDAERLVFVGQRAQLVAIEASSGSEVWTLQLPAAPSLASTDAVTDRIWITQYDGGGLQHVDLATGELVTLPEPLEGIRPAVVDSQGRAWFYYWNGAPGVMGLSPDGARQILPTEGKAFDVLHGVFSGKRTAMVTHRGVVWLDDGQWSPLPIDESGPMPVVHASGLVVAGREGLTSLDWTGAVRWQRPSKESVAALTLCGGLLYTDDGSVFLGVEPATGEVVRRIASLGRPVAAGCEDGQLWLDGENSGPLPFDVSQVDADKGPMLVGAPQSLHPVVPVVETKLPKGPIHVLSEVHTTAEVASCQDGHAYIVMTDGSRGEEVLVARTDGRTVRTARRPAAFVRHPTCLDDGSVAFVAKRVESWSVERWDGTEAWTEHRFLDEDRHATVVAVPGGGWLLERTAPEPGDMLMAFFDDADRLVGDVRLEGLWRAAAHGSSVVATAIGADHASLLPVLDRTAWEPAPYTLDGRPFRIDNDTTVLLRGGLSGMDAATLAWVGADGQPLGSPLSADGATGVKGLTTAGDALWACGEHSGSTLFGTPTGRRVSWIGRFPEGHEPEVRLLGEEGQPFPADLEAIGVAGKRVFVVAHNDASSPISLEGESIPGAAGGAQAAFLWWVGKR